MDVLRISHHFCSSLAKMSLNQAEKRAGKWESTREYRQNRPMWYPLRGPSEHPKILERWVNNISSQANVPYLTNMELNTELLEYDFLVQKYYPFPMIVSNPLNIKPQSHPPSLAGRLPPLQALVLPSKHGLPILAGSRGLASNFASRCQSSPAAGFSLFVTSHFATLL